MEKPNLGAVGPDEVVPDVLKGEDCALNENNPGVVLGVVLELDGVLPKLKFVVLPGVVGVEGLPKLKEDLLSGLFVLLVEALLNGLRGLELSEVEDVAVVVPNGEAVPPVVPNTVGPFGFPNEVVPNVPPLVPNVGLGLLGFVPKDEVAVPLEVPVPNAEPVFANGEVVVPLPIPNPVLTGSLTAAAVAPSPPVVPKVGPKANFGADTPLVVVVVPVEPGVVVCLKLNIGFCVSFFSAATVVVIGAPAGVVVLAADLLKLKENFGVVVAPVVLEDVPVVVVVPVVVAVGVENALTG